MKVLKCIQHGLVLGVFGGFFGLPAYAKNDSRLPKEFFTCKLKVTQSVGLKTRKVLIDVESLEIQLPKGGKKKMFDGLFQTVRPTPAVFLVENSLESSELKVGFYRSMPDQKTLSKVANATGDSRAFAKMSVIGEHEDLDVEFSCTNTAYEI